MTATATTFGGGGGGGGRWLAYSSAVQAVVIAGVLAAQAHFLFPAEASLSPAGVYLMANILAVAALSFAAGVSSRFPPEARRALFAAGGVFLLLFVNELCGHAVGVSDGAAFALWAFAAASLTYLARLVKFSRTVRLAFLTAVVVQGGAMAADLLDDGALGLAKGGEDLLDWVYLAGNLASMVAYQVALLHLLVGFGPFGALAGPKGRGDAPGLPSLAAAVFQARYLLWRRANPDGDFAAYYAHRVSRHLDRGAAHKTLGGRLYRSEDERGRARALDPVEFSARGVKYFDWFAARGLRRDMTCLDFGCGSLRVGRHFMSHLEPGRYIGLDVVDRFYVEGLKLIEPALLERARPTLGVISPRTLADAKARRPDLVFSTAVLQHVPPEELDAYLSKLLGVVADGGVVVTNFKAAFALTRLGASNWAYEPARLIEAAYRADERAHVAIVDGWRLPHSTFEQATLVASRDPARLADWIRRPGFLRA